jgi:hypothetical protein
MYKFLSVIEQHYNSRTWKFSTPSTKTRHWAQSSASLIQLSFLQPVCLSSTLMLFSVFQEGVFHQNSVCFPCLPHPTPPPPFQPHIQSVVAS